MGRASEAGYSLDTDPQSTQPEYSGSAVFRPQSHDTESPSYNPSYNPQQQQQYVSPSSPSHSLSRKPLNATPHSHSQLQNHTQPQSPLSHQSTSLASTTTPQKATWHRFAIPTKSESLTSGFPFHPRLYTLKITHDQWHLFTTDVVNAAKMTGAEDYLAWTTGITAGTLTTPFLLVLAPVVGYYSGKAVHRSTLKKKVREKLGEEGGLRGVLRKWNDTTFREMGFQAWLELPRESGELVPHGGPETVELDADAGLDNEGRARGMDEKKRKKIEKKAAKRFRIILVPLDEVEDRSVPSYGGSESGGGSVRGGGGLSEMGDDSVGGGGMGGGGGGHRETLPPAYWDANAIEAFSDAERNAQYQSQQQQQIHPEGASPIPQQQQQQQSQREPPLESEIRYSRVGGYTNT